MLWYALFVVSACVLASASELFAMLSEETREGKVEWRVLESFRFFWFIAAALVTAMGVHSHYVTSHIKFCIPCAHRM